MKLLTWSHFSVVLIFLSSLSCMHEKISENLVGTPSRVPATTDRLSDFETKPNQEVFWGGNPQAEIVIFQQMSNEIGEIILRQTVGLRRQDETQRAFHAKTHACLQASMVLEKDRPAFVRHGVFADAYTDQPWKLWARFSNGVGWKQADNKPDIRGLSLKLLQVPGKKLMNDIYDETQTQDFVMISSPVGFGRDSREFMDFAEANSQGGGVMGTISTGSYALTHPTTLTPVKRGLISTIAGIPTLTQFQFWSGTPYRLGPDIAMKYTVKPEVCAEYPNEEPSTPTTDQNSKFRDDLILRGAHGFCMGFYIQLQGPDPKINPIEDASVEWSGPFYKVAVLKFPPQKNYEDGVKDKMNTMCNRMSFNPWHAIEDHRPLGNQNRARRWVYGASQGNRHAGSSDVDESQSPIKGYEVH